MPGEFILAMDQGTTSSRSIIFDRDGRQISTSQKEFRQIFPKSGWVEHDPLEVFSSQYDTACDALSRAGLKSSDVAGIGITNQRETVIVWDRATGEPVCNAVVWQDRRTTGICRSVKQEHADLISEMTGLEIDPYFSASKIRWILENEEGVRERASSGDLAFGTVDTWLIWKLTGGAVHATDTSNASRTMLFDIRGVRWAPDLLEIFGVPAALLPEVRDSSGGFGEVALDGPLKGIDILGVAGDQQAALFGQACFRKGDAKNTYGTGCFTLENTGRDPVRSKCRLITTIAWTIGGKTSYALEGSVFIGGAVVQWLRDSLGIIGSSGDIEELAGSVGESAGVHFVPAFAGLGAPYWEPDARGTITGLTRGATKAHIARAALESIAFQSAELIQSMESDSRTGLSELRVDGGATANDLLMQIQADILQIPVVRPKITETTALGAAYLAGLSAGYWKNTDELSGHWQEEKRFEPSISAAKAAAMMDDWKEAVANTIAVTRPI